MPIGPTRGLMYLARVGSSEFHSQETTTEQCGAKEGAECTAPILTFLYPRIYRFRLSPGETVAGRSTQRALPLAGQKVSRVHCRFVFTDDRVVLLDAGSRNGTFVNGRPAGGAELCVGDVLRIGDWVGIFERGSVDPVVIQRISPQILAGACFRQVLNRAEAVAHTNLPILIRGDTGSGKEVVARFIHDNSRRPGPFVAINCAAVPENLAESELFGHQRGAFTGADRHRSGALRAAHAGTLLLDEITDLPMAIQAKLLRALEEGCVTPLGATQSVSVDLRVVVAGQEELRLLVNEGRFRGDLFARLNGIQLDVPPMRDRKEEIIEVFLTAMQRYRGRSQPKLSPELAEALLLYNWPYNAREVVQMGHKVAALYGNREELGMANAPEELLERHSQKIEAALSPAHPAVNQLRASRRLEQLEKLRQALLHHDGNITRAAEALGISRGRAYRLMGTDGTLN